MRSQRGFTLMEVMVSTMATAVVIAAASAFLLHFLAWYDELSAKIAMNRHARETYEVLSLGGLASTTGNDGTKNVYGLRERFAPPTSSMRTNYSVRYISNNLTLTPDLIAGMSITCTGTGTPMPDCTSGSGTKTVTGWLGSHPQTNTSTRSVSNKTVEVTFAIMNPFEIRRAVSPSVFAENYHFIFTLNRNEDDP
jgi:prepilin-type N-terminal cleavage/methylation domain-containing protein